MLEAIINIATLVLFMLGCFAAIIILVSTLFGDNRDSKEK